MASVRKLACSIRLMYSSGRQAETLQGTDFTLDRGVARARFALDLASNLKPWNKGLMCYIEAMEFIANPGELRGFEIREKQVINALTAVPSGLAWQLDIKWRPGQSYSYAVRPDIGPNLATFTVERRIDGGGPV